MTEDIAEDDLEEVVENVALCSECDEYAEHQVLKEKSVGTGKDLLVKCNECDYVYNLQIREPLSIKIPFILTDGPNSKRVELDIDDDERFLLGDVFQDEEMLWSVNQIIDKSGRKKKSVKATEASIISALRTDMVRVKITMTRGEFSDSTSMLVDYELNSPQVQ